MHAVGRLLRRPPETARIGQIPPSTMMMTCPFFPWAAGVAFVGFGAAGLVTSGVDRAIVRPCTVVVVVVVVVVGCAADGGGDVGNVSSGGGVLATTGGIGSAGGVSLTMVGCDEGVIADAGATSTTVAGVGGAPPPHPTSAAAEAAAAAASARFFANALDGIATPSASRIAPSLARTARWKHRRSPSFRLRSSASISSRVIDVASWTSSSHDPQKRVRCASLAGSVDHMSVVAHGDLICNRSASGSFRTISA